MSLKKGVTTVLSRNELHLLGLVVVYLLVLWLMVKWYP